MKIPFLTFLFLGCTFCCAHASAKDQPVTVQVDMGKDQGVFLELDGLPIRALVANQSESNLSGQIHWTIETDSFERLAEKSADLNLGPGEELSVSCQFPITNAGCYRVKVGVELIDASLDADEEISQSKVLAYRPGEIHTQPTREDDFDGFWRATFRKLASVEPAFELTEHPDKATGTHRVFEVQMKSLDGVVVRGWYEQPKSGGVCPALLRVPGYGSNMQPTGWDVPLAVFSFNPRGHGNSQDDVRGKPEDFWIRGLDDKQGYFYQGAYADCVRAVDFLASRPEVDKERIGVTGQSQGGGLSLATAALDPRIQVCAPDIAFLCDWERYFKTSHWPEMDQWVAEKPHRTWETTLRTLSYFDTLNFADRIGCPALFSLGLQDEVCPPATIFAVYNRFAGPKHYHLYPHAGHWTPKRHDGARKAWLLKELGVTTK